MYESVNLITIAVTLNVSTQRHIQVTISSAVMTNVSTYNQTRTIVMHVV